MFNLHMYMTLAMEHFHIHRAKGSGYTTHSEMLSIVELVYTCGTQWGVGLYATAQTPCIYRLYCIEFTMRDY